MGNSWLDTYRMWLGYVKDSERNEEVDSAKETVSDYLCDSAAYQNNTKRNGVPQPMIITRSNTKKCSATVLPGDSMAIGDLVYAFGENWICMELYEDEYALTYAELWMCNHEFVYQDKSGNVIRKMGIVDNGSYSKGSDKSIPVTDNYYVCYVPLDNECDSLCVDKRLAIDVIHDASGAEILDVGKICWLDTKSRNFGEGSHLLAFGLSDDVFNKSTDSVSLKICDYTADSKTGSCASVGDQTDYAILISGKETIRIGTKRTYSVTTTETEQGNAVLTGDSIQWNISPQTQGVVMVTNGLSMTLSVDLNDGLIGKKIVVECSDSSGVYKTGTKEVEVVSIG